MTKLNQKNYRRLRYTLEEAAKELIISIDHALELISEGVIVPYVYNGDIEIDDGKWIAGNWVPILNAQAAFSRVIGTSRKRIRTQFRNYETDDPCTDRWEERVVRLSNLRIPRSEVLKAKKVINNMVILSCDDGEAYVDSSKPVFKHTENFSLIVWRNTEYKILPQLQRIIKRLVDHHRKDLGAIKNKELMNGINGYDGQFSTAIRKLDMHHLYSDKGGFIERDGKGFFRLALPGGCRFKVFHE